MTDAIAEVRHRNFLTLVHYSGDSQSFARLARLSSDSVAAWESDGESLTEDRAALIEQRLKLPTGWLSRITPEPLRESITECEVIRVDAVTQMTIRRTNLQCLADKAGSKAALSPLCGMASSNLSKVFRDDFSEYIARKMESNLGLPAGWLDVERPVEAIESEIPSEVREKLNQVASQSPSPAGRKPGRKPGRKAAPKPAEQSAVSRPDPHGIPVGRNWQPLCRVLVEKTATLINSGLLTEEVAYTLVGQLMQLERGVTPKPGLPEAAVAAVASPVPSALPAVTPAPSAVSHETGSAHASNSGHSQAA